MGPVFLNRYDPVPALLTSLALVAVLAAHERSAGALLGAGTAIKLYPAIFVPLRCPPDALAGRCREGLRASRRQCSFSRSC